MNLVVMLNMLFYYCIKKHSILSRWGVCIKRNALDFSSIPHVTRIRIPVDWLPSRVHLFLYFFSINSTKKNNTFSGKFTFLLSQRTC